MTSSRIVLATLLTYVVTRPAHATEPAEVLPVSWATVASVAGRIFDAGPGASMALRIDAAEEAAALAPGRLTALHLELGQDAGVANSPSVLGETTASVGLGWSLHNPALLRDARRRHGDALGAETRLSRFEFIARVEEAFLAWWAAAAVATHLAEHRDEVAETLKPLEAAAAKNLLPRLDLLDLRAALARLASEVSLAEQARADAHAGLEEALGAPVSPALDEGRTLDQEPTENPWDEVVGRIAAHPALAVSAVRAEAAVAEAVLADDDAPWSIAAFVTTRHDGTGPTWLGAVLQLSLPLSRPRAAEVVALRAESRAIATDAVTAVRRASAVWMASARRYAALRQHRQELTQGRLAVLRERQDALDRAWVARQVPFERVVRARQELHEAVHELYLVTAALLAEESRANALLTRLAAPMESR